MIRMRTAALGAAVRGISLNDPAGTDACANSDVLPLVSWARKSRPQTGAPNGCRTMEDLGWRPTGPNRVFRGAVGTTTRTTAGWAQRKNNHTDNRINDIGFRAVLTQPFGKIKVQRCASAGSPTG